MLIRIMDKRVLKEKILFFINNLLYIYYKGIYSKSENSADVSN